MLSSTGRMSRLPFLACAALLLALAAGYEYGLALGLGFRAGWVVYPLILFPTACILSKRLHDRGRAGWWGFLIVWALVEAWPAETDPTRVNLAVIAAPAWIVRMLGALPIPTSPFGWVALLVLAVTLFDLAFMPGEPGQNRFGQNPAAAQRSGPAAS